MNPCIIVDIRILWSQIGLLNVDGYYDSLLTLFDNMQAQGFLEFNARTLVVSAPTPAELLDKLEVSKRSYVANYRFDRLQLNALDYVKNFPSMLPLFR